MKIGIGKLGFRLLLVYTLTIGGTGFFLGKHTINFFKQEILSQTTARQSEIVRSEAITLDNAITEGSLLAQTLAYSSELRQFLNAPQNPLLENRAKKKLESFLRANHRFSAAAIIGNDYRLKLHHGKRIELSPESAHDYWEISFAHGLDPFHAMARIPVFIDRIRIPIEDQTLTQSRYLVPILDENNLLLGIVALDLNLSQILDFLFLDARDYDYVILDEDGEILLTRLVSAATGRPSFDLGAFLRMHGQDIVRRTGGAFVDQQDEVENLIVYRRIIPQEQTGLQFTLLTILPTDEVFASLRIMEKTLATTIGSAFVFLLAMIGFFTYHHVKPLRSLSEKMISYLPGFTLQLPERETRRNDEIGYLYQSFDRLDKQLSHAFTNLDHQLSELSHKNQLLEKATKEAQELGQAKSDFLAVMSHEIRTPLNAIVGYAGLLEGADQDLTDTEEIKLYCRRIHSNSERLLSLIDNILDFTRISSGRTSLDYKAFFPSEELENVLLEYREKVSDGVSLKENFTSDRWIAMISDPVRWHQVVENLISNAIKFTEKGHIHIEAGFKDIQEPEQKAVFYLTVSDTGSGIPKEKQKLIFEPFEQVDNSMRRKYQGSGLGLAICRKLVNLMRGTLELESEENKGTTFKVIIPCQIRHEENEAQTIEEILEPNSHSSTEKQEFLLNRKILVIEDDPQNANVLRNHLTLAGAERVGIAETEGDFENLLKDEVFDIILLDIHLGRENGLDFLEKFRAGEYSTPTPYNCPIFVLSAFVGAEMEKQAMDAGADGFFTKPLYFRKFIEDIGEKIKQTC
ncbi:MAG: response regulator [Opitutales bacterium]|nr:response regulator [Opitutales bacterium]MCH8541481.1 response regulator [Opitutales bacterium]